MAAAALAGCASNQPVRVGAHQVNAGIAADEPRAAAIGRDILSQGGNAVDAATAMALAMSVTLPTRVGLGGGGVCVVHDATSSQTRTIDFLPRPASGGSAASGNGDAVAVPGMVRGIAALHAAHGKKRWEQLVAPAEAKARIDTQISRALARDLQVFGGIAGEDQAAKAVYLPTGATPPGEGQGLQQDDLANVLSQLRQRGAGAFYSGQLGEKIATGLGIAPKTLGDYQAQWRQTADVQHGNDTVHFASVPEGAPAAEALRAALTASDGKRNAGLIKALEKVEPEGPPTAGLVSFDQFGQAVACTFSLGGPFGTGKMIPGTGIMQAKATGARGIGGPAVMVNPNLNHPLFAGNGGLIGVGVGEEGAGAAPAALVNVALRAIEQGMTAQEAVAAPRLAPDPAGGTLIEETAERSAAGVEGEIYSVQALGRVNLVSCKVDRSTGSRSCAAATDPRGFGIAYTIE
jgi:gamma-glutamyltranspeptidase/glutathione hydrolase